jgi:hypothetical protein
MKQDVRSDQNLVGDIFGKNNAPKPQLRWRSGGAFGPRGDDRQRAPDDVLFATRERHWVGADGR